METLLKEISDTSQGFRISMHKLVDDNEATQGFFLLYKDAMSHKTPINVSSGEAI
jgi:hypothetical protein